MKKLLCLLPLLLAGCGAPVPAEERAAMAKAELEQAKAQQNLEAIREKQNWYGFLRSRASVLCVNGTQYIGWYSSVAGHSSGTIRNMTPVIINGAHRSCQGGISLEM